MGACLGSRRPSTTTRSTAGSTVVPMVVTGRPFTVTRPWAMSCSAFRREATPAWAITYCKRTPCISTPPSSTLERCWVIVGTGVRAVNSLRPSPSLTPQAALCPAGPTLWAGAANKRAIRRCDCCCNQRLVFSHQPLYNMPPST